MTIHVPSSYVTTRTGRDQVRRFGVGSGSGYLCSPSIVSFTHRGNCFSNVGGSFDFSTTCGPLSFNNMQFYRTHM